MTLYGRGLEVNLVKILTPSAIPRKSAQAAQAAQTTITVDGVDKKTKVGEIVSHFRKTRKLSGLVDDAFKLWKVIR